MLTQSKSLFIQAYSNSKVQWQEFTQDVIKEAMKDNKPIFLHSGYSTSHLSTEFQKNVFEDEEISKMLNEQFTPILLDKDLFFDVDQYFQKILYVKTGELGWPTNIFLTPKLEPIFLGTFLPRDPQENYPGFLNICNNVLDQKKSQPKEITKHALEILELIKKPIQSSEPISYEGHFPSPNSIMDALKEYTDQEFGGFGESLKLPNLSFFEWAVEQMLEGVLTQEHGEFVIKSLENMILSPLFDQVRGGMHHYSHNKDWSHVNFEKFLIDQANLLRVLSKITMLYPSPIFLDALILTIEYLSQEMFNEETGFFTSQGSFSEEIDGLYFGFTEEEFEEVFQDDDEKDTLKLKKWFGITQEGNRHNRLNELSLKSIYLEEILEPKNWNQLRRAKTKLFQKRSERIPPKTDPKCLSHWNFSIISALCDVIQYTKIEVLQKDATNLLNQCLQNIHKTFFSKKKDKELALYHTNIKANPALHLDDYVAFAEAHSRLFEVTGKEKFKTNVLQTLEFILEEFKDENSFLITSKKSTSLFHNFESTSIDQQMRSPTSTLYLLLQKWSFENHSFKEVTKNIKKSYTQKVLSNPITHGEGLRALSYPDEAFKMINLPKSWFKDKTFLKLRTYFSSRFFLNAQESNDWSIQGYKSLEAEGKTIEDFEKYLMQKN